MVGINLRNASFCGLAKLSVKKNFVSQESTQMGDCSKKISFLAGHLKRGFSYIILGIAGRGFIACWWY